MRRMEHSKLELREAAEVGTVVLIRDYGFTEERLVEPGTSDGVSTGSGPNAGVVKSPGLRVRVWRWINAWLERPLQKYIVIPTVVGIILVVLSAVLTR